MRAGALVACLLTHTDIAPGQLPRRFDRHRRYALDRDQPSEDKDHQLLQRPGMKRTQARTLSDSA